MPLDVTVIKGAVVQVFAGTVTAENYKAGILTMDGDRMVDASSVIAQTKDKSIFVGLADNIRMSSGRGSTLAFRARDLTQILIDYKVPTSVIENLPDPEIPLNRWIMNVCATHPVISQYITACVNHKSDALQIPLASTSQGFSNAGSKKHGKRYVPKTFSGLSYWDLIVDVCVGAGWIPNVENTEIAIRKAQTFLGREYWKDTRFSRVIDGERTHVRKLVHGRNVKDISIERDIAGVSVPAVQVITSRNGITGSATFPPADSLKSKSLADRPTFSGDGQEQQQKILVIPVSGPSDSETLQRLAKDLWEIIKRQEFKGTVATTDIYSYGGDESDPDNLYLRPGDPVEYTPDTDASFSDDIVKAYSMDEGVFENMLRHYDQDDSTEGETFRLIAMEILRRSKRQRVFRVSEVQHTFNAQSGYDIKVDFHNYYEVLWDEVKSKGLARFGVSMEEQAAVEAPEGGVE
jgi:hypothetical protein